MDMYIHQKHALIGIAVNGWYFEVEIEVQFYFILFFYFTKIDVVLDEGLEAE